MDQRRLTPGEAAGCEREAPAVHRSSARRRGPCPRAAYGAADAAAAWDRRRRDLDDLDGIIDVLTDVERRADELNRRAAELVEGWL